MVGLADGAAVVGSAVGVSECVTVGWAVTGFMVGGALIGNSVAEVTGAVKVGPFGSITGVEVVCTFVGVFVINDVGFGETGLRAGASVTLPKMLWIIGASTGGEADPGDSLGVVLSAGDVSPGRSNSEGADATLLSVLPNPRGPVFSVASEDVLNPAASSGE